MSEAQSIGLADSMCPSFGGLTRPARAPSGTRQLTLLGAQVVSRPAGETLLFPAFSTETAQLLPVPPRCHHCGATMSEFRLTKAVLREFEYEPRRSSRQRVVVEHFEAGSESDSDAAPRRRRSGTVGAARRGGASSRAKVSASSRSSGNASRRPYRRSVVGINPFDAPEAEDVSASDASGNAGAGGGRPAGDEEDEWTSDQDMSERGSRDVSNSSGEEYGERARTQKPKGRRPRTENLVSSSSSSSSASSLSNDDDDDDVAFGSSAKSPRKRRRMTFREKALKKRKREQEELEEDIDLMEDDEIIEWNAAKQRAAAAAADGDGAGGACGSFDELTVPTVERVLDDELTEHGNEFLVKWKGRSHLHNTRETLDALLARGVKGIKIVENYIAGKDQRIEQQDGVDEEEDREDYRVMAQVERIIGARYYDPVRRKVLTPSEEATATANADIEYLCKFYSCENADATWEKASTISPSFQDKIDAYLTHCANPIRPTPVSRYRRSEADYEPLKAQPEYLGRGDPRLALGQPVVSSEDAQDRLAESLPKNGAAPFQLRDYQLQGLNWLSHAWFCRRNVILADEMGLGKTAQTICLISWLVHARSVSGPFLVVVPLSTLESWKVEFSRWDPSLHVVSYVGSTASRDIIWERETKNFHVLLTTFDLFVKDSWRFIEVPKWSLVAVDEAHRLKNDESRLYQEMAQLRLDFCVLITGTPLQNSLRELWCLLHFLDAGSFPSAEEFEEDFADVSTNASTVRQLHTLLAPYILRRRKRQVAKSLPPKTERILRVPMSPLQKQIYRSILTKNFRSLYEGSKNQRNLLNIVMELRKCSNHPFLFPAVEAMYNTGRPEYIANAASKMTLLDKLLRRLKEGGHRVLIFSQMVRMLDIIQYYLQLASYKFQRLDGSSKREDRIRALKHFNDPQSDDFVFLLSTRAGGLGINLHTADTVIIYDSDWNPQNDLQAQARAHRIGQTRHVSIFRFVTGNTVEEDVLRRARDKRVLDHLVIRGAKLGSEKGASASAATGGRHRHAQSEDDLSRTSGGTNAWATDFSADQLNAILKFGAEELFKDSTKGLSTVLGSVAALAEDGTTSRTAGEPPIEQRISLERGAEFDLDAILDDAERRFQTVQPTSDDGRRQHPRRPGSGENSSYNGGDGEDDDDDDDLLSSFKSLEPIIVPPSSATTGSPHEDEFWKNVLPQHEVDALAARELQEEEVAAAAAWNSKRNRTTAASATAAAAMSSGGTGAAGSSGRASSSTKQASIPVNVKNVVGAMRKFGDDAAKICASLGQPLHKKQQVASLCEEILKESEKHVHRHDLASGAGEDLEDGDHGHEGGERLLQQQPQQEEEGGGPQGDPRIEGIRCAEVLLRVKQLKSLAQLVLRYAGQVRSIRIPNPPALPKALTDVGWTPEDDGLLLFAAHDHGIGNWDAWRHDGRLSSMLDKVQLSAPQTVAKQPLSPDTAAAGPLSATATGAMEEEASQAIAAPGSADSPEIGAKKLPKATVLRRLDSLLKKLAAPGSRSGGPSGTSGRKRERSTEAVTEGMAADGASKRTKAMKEDSETGRDVRMHSSGGKAPSEKQQHMKHAAAAGVSASSSATAAPSSAGSGQSELAGIVERLLKVSEVRKAFHDLQNVEKAGKEGVRRAIMVLGDHFKEMTLKHPQSRLYYSKLWTLTRKKTGLNADEETLMKMYDKYGAQR